MMDKTSENAGDAIRTPSKQPRSVAVVEVDEAVSRRYDVFFTSRINNPDTRKLYAWAVTRFTAWCDAAGITILQVKPETVSIYIAQLPGSASIVLSQLAAIRKFFDWMVEKEVMLSNPVRSIPRPRHTRKAAVTPTAVLTASELRHLLRSIETSMTVGLRDMALIAVMVHCFLRVHALLGLRLEDYERNATRAWLHVREGGRSRRVPVDQEVAAYVDAYIKALTIRNDRDGKLFRAISYGGKVKTGIPLTAMAVTKIVKDRTRAAGLPETIGCNSLRMTGIKLYMENGGNIEDMLVLSGLKGPANNFRHLTVSK
jgi:site-specific recombinase XerD